MKKSKNKAILIITLITLVLCGCPGSFLALGGFLSLGENLASVVVGDYLVDVQYELLEAGAMICLGGLILLVPLIMIILTLTQRKTKETLEALEPTGASAGDPIPPTT